MVTTTNGDGPGGRLYGRRYPWDAWFTRGRVLLVRGIDFNGRMDTFSQQVRRAAVSRRLSIVLTVDDDGRSLTVEVRGMLGPIRKRGRRRAAGAAGK